MGIDSSRVSVGTVPVKLADVKQRLHGKLSLISGIIDWKSKLQPGISEKDMYRGIMHPILILGLPGVGKTASVMAAVEEINEELATKRTDLKDSKGNPIQFGFKKILLGQTIVGEVSGLLVPNGQGGVVRVPYDGLPQVDRDGEYGVLFLDEITTADNAQVQPALGLCDDSRNIGTYQLPKNWYVVAAGNGPDCANFVQLPDMTISRFEVFDLDYKYRTDWKPWALNHGINSTVLAFLDFHDTREGTNDAIVRVESSDMDASGKQFACPRTWTALSYGLLERKIQSKPVSKGEAYEFAASFIGESMASEFTAFLQYTESNEYDVKKIIEGKEKDPSFDIKAEVFFIVSEALVEEYKAMFNGVEELNAEQANLLANGFRWLLTLKKTVPDRVVTALSAFKVIPSFYDYVMSDEFSNACPEYDEWLTEQGSSLLEATMY